MEPKSRDLGVVIFLITVTPKQIVYEGYRKRRTSKVTLRVYDAIY